MVDRKFPSKMTPWHLEWHGEPKRPIEAVMPLKKRTRLRITVRYWIAMMTTRGKTGAAQASGWVLRSNAKGILITIREILEETDVLQMTTK